MEHVSSVSCQPVGNPDVHRGARQPAGPLVYGLETKTGSDADEEYIYIYYIYIYVCFLYLKYLESQI